MLAFNRRTKIYMSKEATDMRASYDTLFNKAKTVLKKDPFSGHLFVYMNKRRTATRFRFVSSQLSHMWSSLYPYEYWIFSKGIFCSTSLCLQYRSDPSVLYTCPPISCKIKKFFLPIEGPK